MVGHDLHFLKVRAFFLAHLSDNFLQLDFNVRCYHVAAVFRTPHNMVETAVDNVFVRLETRDTGNRHVPIV